MRTTAIHVAVATIVVSLLASAPPAWSAPGSGGDWLQFGFDSRDGGSNPHESTIDASNVAGIQPVWRFRIGRNMYSSPAVVNGILYMGSNDGSVYAVRTASAGAARPADRVIWTFQTGREIRSSPAVVGGVVYIGSDDNQLYALDAASGSKLWGYQTGGDVPSSPVVADGSVYVGSEDGHLYALDAAAGVERWDVAMPYGGESSATVSKGVVYYTNPASATLFALSASTGDEIWRFAGAVARPAVANGTVYVATAGGVVALDPGTGAKRWGQSADMSNWSPVVEGNEVFIATYSGGVVAFNATTGRHLWTASIPGGVYTTVAAANGVVYAGTQQSGRFVCLDASSGHQILSVESYSIFSSAVIADGVIYAGTGRRTLFGYGLP